jgi:hypothetical protein
VIVKVAALLIGWEVIALNFNKPTVTDLSSRWPWSLGAYGFVAWLFVHFIRAGRTNVSDCSCPRTRSSFR